MSLRKISSKTLLFSAVLFIFLPLLPAEAQDVDIPGNLFMRNSTDMQGNIVKGGVIFLHNFGTGNTFLGANAGNLGMSGNYNTGSGFRALQLNTTGDYNTATGYAALLFNTTGQNNTASGVGALIGNTTGGGNTANGHNALSSNTTGGSNTAAGWRALYSNLYGSGNTALGTGADVSSDNLSNATAIGAGAIVTGSNTVRLGNTDVTVIEGQVPFTFTSDRNQKENFQSVDGEDVLTKIRGMSLTSWNYVGHDPRQFRHYGPVAQDFFAAFGHDGVGTIGAPTTITSGDLDGVLMIATQALDKRTMRQERRCAEQEKRYAEQSRDINALMVENRDLKARLEALERRVGTQALTAAQ